MDDDDFECFVTPEIMGMVHRLGACQGAKLICDAVIGCIESSLTKEIDPELVIDDLSEAISKRRRLYKKEIRKIKEALDDDD